MKYLSVIILSIIANISFAVEVFCDGVDQSQVIKSDILDGFLLSIYVHEDSINAGGCKLNVEIERVEDGEGIITIADKYLDFHFSVSTESDNDVTKTIAYRKKTEGTFDLNRRELTMKVSEKYGFEFDLESMYHIDGLEKISVSVTKSIGSVASNSYKYISTPLTTIHLTTK